MNLFGRGLAVALATGLCLGVATAGESPKSPLLPTGKEATCGEFGTSVHFEDSPADAAKQALKDEKLVMVLHVSGHFEDPRFT